MPFIFPKRFLRTRDILDPLEMAQDYQPVQEVLSGHLDGQNFNAAKLKSGLNANQYDDDDPAPEGEVDFVSGRDAPAVDDEAYYQFETASVESWVRMNRHPGVLRERTSPNFAEKDGVTFRDQDIYSSELAGEITEGVPSIIPNTGEWSVVKNVDLSDGLSVSVTTGRANVWVNCYLQYCWQGFFENRNPWSYYGPNDPVHTAGGWDPLYEDEVAEKERDKLNSLGPGTRKVYKSSVSMDGFGEVDEAYSYPLNELSSTEERRHPNFCGNHHISKGFYPALVQFAIRVDGKVIDESIVGKKYSFEESAHGLKIADSPELEGEEIETDVSEPFIFAQRSAEKSMSYEEGRGSVPGRKIRTTRAVACGPEVLPVRLGCVVPVLPGTHKIEIVARRVQRKKKNFSQGDFVGVFSRRIYAISLPLTAKDSDDAVIVHPRSETPVSAPSFQTEGVVDANLILASLDKFRTRCNELSPRDIKPYSIPNTHLPSKIASYQTRSLNLRDSPVRDSYTGQLLGSPDGGIIRAIYPGDRRASGTAPYRNEVTIGRWGKAYDGSGSSPGTSAWNGAGWNKIVNADGEGSLVSTTDRWHIESGKTKLLVMADIELLNLDPHMAKIYYDMLTATGHWETQAIRSFCQPHKYLDLFAFFNIGYRTGSDASDNWIINSKFAPAAVNNFNTYNRTEHYLPSNVTGNRINVKSEDDSWETAGGFESPPLKRDMRGMNTLTTNLCVNIPITLMLEDTVEISEIALFGATNFPSVWDVDEAVHVGSGGMTYTKREWRKPDGSSSHDEINYAWGSTVGGRGILTGLAAHVGRTRLSAIKFKV
jgi:hypothetical protein|tara:strand:- start:6073 stop:8538 length:2466 start_codon:yes stop_codon:yes gene_type:complete